jgi:hypothetical protein
MKPETFLINKLENDFKDNLKVVLNKKDKAGNLKQTGKFGQHHNNDDIHTFYICVKSQNKQ